MVVHGEAVKPASSRRDLRGRVQRRAVAACYDVPRVALSRLGPHRTLRAMRRALVAVLVLAAAAPAAAYAQYRGVVRSVHPGAVSDPTRNWTYLGDTVRVAFRNTTLARGRQQTYRVCYTRGPRLACQTRRLRGPGWDSWRLRIMPPWAGHVGNRYTRYVAFTWRVGSRVVSAARIWIYE